MLHRIPIQYRTAVLCALGLVLFCFPWTNTEARLFSNPGFSPKHDWNEWFLSVLYPDWTSHSNVVMLSQSGLQATLGMVSCNCVFHTIPMGNDSIKEFPYPVDNVKPAVAMMLYPLALLVALFIASRRPPNKQRFYLVAVPITFALALSLFQAGLGFPLADAKHDYDSISNAHFYGWFWLAQAALAWTVVVEYKCWRWLERHPEAIQPKKPAYIPPTGPPIALHCPECYHVINVPTEFFGSRFECPVCTTTFRVPRFTFSLRPKN